MGKNDSRLEKYQHKRDFRRTREPHGDMEQQRGNKPIFVIQKHDASRLHYDFRIEVDGVLKSWAVPKGPSTDPREKRLAVPTEDHPMEYGDFEGVIPAGEYGGGTVMIWDRGAYENLKKNNAGEPVSMSDSLERGHVVIFLKGEKIRGGYGLIRTGKDKQEQEQERWLLVKMDDEDADARRNPVSTEPLSVASGRDLEQIAAEEGDD